MESNFIETLKLRQQEAAKRLHVAQVKLQAAQSEFNLAAQYANSWNVAIAAEMQRVQQEKAEEEAQAAAERAESTVSAESTQPKSGDELLNNLRAAVGKPVSDTPAAAPPNTPDINKTTLVRDVLSRNPNGMRPYEIRKELNNQLTAAYVHSVLHRLMDRDEVGKKRGKYYMKQPHPQEVAGHNSVAQQH
jgi:hypothetical protein